MPLTNFLFTSESVTEGHPDKVADQISDAILDDLLAQDPKSRVACETLVTTGVCLVAGEVTTQGYCDIPAVVRETVPRDSRQPQYESVPALPPTCPQVVRRGLYATRKRRHSAGNRPPRVLPNADKVPSGVNQWRGSA